MRRARESVRARRHRCGVACAGFVGFVGAIGAVYPSAWAGGHPMHQRLVYQRDVPGDPGGTEVELESAVGTRDIRPFGRRGIENGVRVRHRFSRRLSMEAWGGALVSETIRGAGEIRLGLVLFDDEKRGIDVTGGFGVRRDFEGVVIPEAGLSAGIDWGHVILRGSGRVEMPRSDQRDAVDLLIGLGAAYRLSSSAALGIECAGEDLEGFWDEDEAEGGARLVAGPTLLYSPTASLSIRANVGGTMQMTSSRPGSPDGSDADHSPSEAGAFGLLGRAAVGVSF